MRALVISDIHSNRQALEAVLDAAPKHDEVWNLGDIVGYGANPNEVVDVVTKLDGIVVRGNHDRICSGNMKFGEYRSLNPLASFAARWTQKTLSAENREWLARLPQGPVRTLGRKVACVHGSPRDDDLPGRCHRRPLSEASVAYTLRTYALAGRLVLGKAGNDRIEASL